MNSETIDGLEGVESQPQRARKRILVAWPAKVLLSLSGFSLVMVALSFRVCPVANGIRLCDDLSHGSDGRDR